MSGSCDEHIELLRVSSAIAVDLAARSSVPLNIYSLPLLSVFSMSFGFDVGNFADAAHLAYLIYRDCYKVARGAPQEFQLLVSEVSTLSSSLKILQEDVKDPESPLLQAGDDRVKLVNDMVENIRVTLNKMEKVARKYEIMGSTTASKGKQMWTRFKWTFDWSTIEKLREKLNQHNTMMSLLLTQIGNSSLQKIQSSTNALESDIHEIRKHIAAQQGGKLGNQEGSKGTPIPFLSFEHDEFLVKDDTSRSSLSASLLRHAEVHQPWSTVGVSQWIETGTWWLLRVSRFRKRPLQDHQYLGSFILYSARPTSPFIQSHPCFFMSNNPMLTTLST